MLFNVCFLKSSVCIIDYELCHSSNFFHFNKFSFSNRSLLKWFVLRLTKYEFLWSNMSFFDQIWVSLIKYEWVSLIKYEFLWSNMSEFLWSNMSFFDQIWVSLIKYEFLWSNMSLFDQIWVSYIGIL